MHPEAEHFARRAHGAFIAAIATPMTASGETDPAVTASYAHAVMRDGASGLAAAVHTGRGPHLSIAERKDVVLAASEAADLVVTGVQLDESGEIGEWPRHAADAGASALLVFTPRALVAQDLRRGLDQLWDRSGLPLILFDLYSSPLDHAALPGLLDHPAVAAFKPARLRAKRASRNGIELAARAGRTVLSGEDLMLPESLSWGASGALIGLGAACTGLTAAFLRAFRADDTATLRRLSPHLDTFANSTFVEPMDAYVQRMLWVAVDEGTIPPEFGFDPRGATAPDPATRAAVIEAARAARAAVVSAP
ncbi:dihydrodipicolinate synthase family protein [Agromyces silvae]|uniref:dihydrodipicolinate synthase family protein n=1 Tax=Agromyces silvae TaxID=3388266 RepID=UPI00280C1B52|nr:dihydrodipicolinate synthase family protein [Agromyces protaetiae]